MLIFVYVDGYEKNENILQKPNYTTTYFSGGMLLFSAGLIPLSSAFLE
jgi:hypothetical protein